MLVVFVLLCFAPSGSSQQVDSRIQEGLAALDSGNLTGARLSFEQATRLDPKHAGAWLLLAQTFAKQSAPDLAIAAARKAEMFGGGDPAILQGLANFYGSLVPDLPKAAEMGARYAETNPNDVTAWRRVAGLYLSIGKLEQAIAAGVRGLRADPGPELRVILGRAYTERKQWADAATELSEAVRLDPYNEDAHFRLSQVYLLQQDFPRAIGVLENARKTFDKSPQIELALGVAYYGARQFPQAVNQFLKTAALAPGLPQPYYFLGRMMDHLADRLPEVTERVAAFEAQNPRSYLGPLLHAKLLMAELPPSGFGEQAAAALALVEKSLALREDDADAQHQAGVLLERKGEFAAAAAHLERSIALNDKDPAPHFGLARVYERLGRKSEAEQQRALHASLSGEEKAGASSPARMP